MKKPLLRMLWCDRVAPLGNPAVPEVYWMLMGSSNWSRASRSRSRSTGTRPAPARSSPPPAAPPPHPAPPHPPGRGVPPPQPPPPVEGGELRGHLAEHVQVVGLAEAGGQDQGRHPGLAEGIGQRQIGR